MMHARIGTFEVAPARLDAAVAYLRDGAVAEFSRCDGFIGYQAYVDRERGRIVGISLWTTRDALVASTPAAQRALRAAAELGAVLAGDPQILELAFDSRVRT